MNSPKSFQSLVLHLHPRSIPEHAADIPFTWCLGGLALWMFVLEIATGMLLMFQYMPTGSGAYASIQNITFMAPYGFFIRNLHYWLGQFMVIFVVLHMIRVILTGSYAPPRRFNWTIGLVLLVVTVFVDFTGYILVWDDRSLWAWTIARNLVQSVPVAGLNWPGFSSGRRTLET